MKTLFILKSQDKLVSCLEHIKPDDGLLLIEDAANIARQAIPVETKQLMVIEEDLIARGIIAINSQWQKIDYDGFVEQTLAFDKSVTWL